MLASVHVYKDHLLAARCRLRQLRSLGRGDAVIPREIARIYARRQGRIWSGICGTLVFLSIPVDLVHGGQRAALLLLATWPTMAIAFSVAYLLARLHLRQLNKRQTASGDELTDLARIEGGWATRLALSKAQRATAKSLALPLAALCLATPLTLHLLHGAIACLVESRDCFSLGSGATRLRNFSEWIRFSLIIVGHAHLVLVGLAVRHAVLLRRDLAAGASGRGIGRGFFALLWTTAASLIPGIFLLFIPSIIVLFTGLAFVPWIFAWTARRARKETAVLASYTSSATSRASSPGNRARR